MKTDEAIISLGESMKKLTESILIISGRCDNLEKDNKAMQAGILGIIGTMHDIDRMRLMNVLKEFGIK